MSNAQTPNELCSEIKKKTIFKILKLWALELYCHSCGYEELRIFSEHFEAFWTFPGWICSLMTD